MIEAFISSAIMILTSFYIWNWWNDKKINFKSIKTWLLMLFTIIATTINYFTANSFIKIVNITLIFIIVHKYLFDTKFKYSIIGPILSQLICFISESIFMVLSISIFRLNVNAIASNCFGNFIANLVIAVIMIIISRIRYINKLYNKLFMITNRFDEIHVLMLSILGIIIYNIFAANIYYELDPQILMFMSVLISILSFALVCMFFKAKDDYYKINDKYNSSLESLKELENALTNHRIDNHENRNHLMTIRNMTTSKKIIKFIDTILDNKLKDDKNISKETDIIPAGGLRGLVYSKLLLMNSKEIEYELDVASSVRLVNILDYGNDTMLDICKIVGIFLDNAIEEVETIEDKYIVIEMYLEEDVLIITITNTFDNTKCKDNIYKAGVSTKGGNHGYGLSLVKKLVHHNKKLKTYHEINDSEFTQVLKIYK